MAYTHEKCETFLIATMCLHSAQQMPCLEMPIWQAGIGDISSNVRGACCMERLLWVPFGGLGTSALDERHFICLSACAPSTVPARR